MYIICIYIYMYIIIYLYYIYIHMYDYVRTYIEKKKTSLVNCLFLREMRFSDY